MAGDQENSWKSLLTQAGISCVPVFKGMGEYANVVSLWIEHLKQAVDQLK
jgi:sirohydrochlorin cobaltochelatase